MPKYRPKISAGKTLNGAIGTLFPSPKKRKFALTEIIPMLVNKGNITQKNYRKLHLRVRPEGFSWCVADTLEERVTAIGQKDFGPEKLASAEENYAAAFLEIPELQQDFDSVSVTHDNGFNAFVPTALFDENYLGSYLQYNTKVFEGDYFTFDELANYGMYNVYIPYVNLNNFLLERFGAFDYQHTSSVLVTRLLDLSRNNDEKQVFAHFQPGRFELIVAQNQKLLLFNSFEFRTKEDFIYYVLFAAEQLNLNPEVFKLHLLGEISETDDCYKIAYKFVRNVSLLDVANLEAHNDFSTATNRSHFILLHS